MNFFRGVDGLFQEGGAHLAYFVRLDISSHQMILSDLGCSYWTAKNSTFEEVLSTNMAEDSHVYEGFLRFWTFVIILQVN